MDHLKERLDQYSAEMGMPASTAAAFLIAEALNKKDREKNIAIDMAIAMTPGLTSWFENLVADPTKADQMREFAARAGIGASSGASPDAEETDAISPTE
jgi:hypothetical protein